MVKAKKSKAASCEKTPKKVLITTQITALAVYTSFFITGCLIAMLSPLQQKDYSITAIVSFSAASFITGFVSAIKLRKNGLLTGLLFTLPMNLLVLLLSLIFGGFKVDLNLLYSVVALPLSAAIGGIFAVNKRAKAKRGRK